jgi:hypothetical protein
MKQDSSPRCSAASANPLTNALLISNDGSGVAPAPKASARRDEGSDDEEVARPRASTSERPKSIIEQRAEEEQRKARLANAVHNHQVQVGMTKAQIFESWGQPSKVWIQITPRGRRDVWTYSGDNGSTDVYFNSGVVSDFIYNN